MTLLNILYIKIENKAFCTHEKFGQANNGDGRYARKHVFPNVHVYNCLKSSNETACFRLQNKKYPVISFYASWVWLLPQSRCIIKKKKNKARHADNY